MSIALISKLESSFHLPNESKIYKIFKEKGKKERELSKSLDIISYNKLQKEEIKEEFLYPTEDQSPITKPYFATIIEIIKLGIPTILSYLLDMITDVANYFIIGQLDDHKLLAACGLGNFITGICIFSLVIGFISALDTLLAQTYGALDFVMLGKYFNISFALVNIMLIPLSFITYFLGDILIFMGQDEEIGEYVNIYIRASIPSIILNAEFELIKKYLQCQKSFLVITISILITTPLHILYLYIFILYFNFGLIGAAMATQLTFLSNTVILIIYIKSNSDLSRGWKKLEIQDLELSGVKEYLKLGIPAAIMVCGAECGIILLGFEAGFLSSEQLAAHTILMNLASLLWVSFFALSQVEATLVGNSIGARVPEMGRQYAISCGIIAAVMLGFLVTLIYMFRKEYAYLFTSNPLVVDIVTSTIPLLLFNYIPDGLCTIEEAIIRGCGKQKKASIINVVCFMLIMHFSSITLAFGFNLGIKGLWLAFLIASTCAALSYYYIIGGIQCSIIILALPVLGTDSKYLEENKQEYKEGGLIQLTNSF